MLGTGQLCVHTLRSQLQESFFIDSISIALITLYDLFHIHLSPKNNVRTKLKENTNRLLITFKIQVDGQDDGQDDKNNERTGMKNVCFFFFFLLLWPLGPTAMK